jgi:glycogen synthase
VLRWGGFRDTVVEGKTGVFFDRPDAGEIRTAVDELATLSWDPHQITAHADLFSEQSFVARLRTIVEEAVNGVGVR